MTLDAQLRKLAQAALKGWTESSTASTKSAARVALKDPDSSALTLFVAANLLLGHDFLEFEPETLWLELGDLPVGNRDKLLASIAVVSTPSFFWDYRVFGNTALALGGDPVYPEQIPHASALSMAWSIFEARLTFALEDDFDPEYDDEIAAYVAASLADQGYVLAPEFLAFAQDKLTDLLSDDGKELLPKVREAWEKTPRDTLNDKSFEDNSLGVQLSRLAGVQLGLTHLAETATKNLLALVG